MKICKLLFFVFIISMIVSCKDPIEESEETSFMIITHKADNLTKFSAKLHGIVVAPTRVSISEYGFLVTENGMLIANLTMGSLNFPGNFDRDIGGLAAGTTYSYCAYAFDQHDFSRQDTIKGAILKFTTYP